MSWTFEATQAGYANLWRSATLKGGADAANAETFADKIIEAEQRYKAVQAATGVPWFFIGALHMRESSCNFAGVLHNGEHIIGTGRVTTLEPPNRGPFSSWEEAAVDALKLKNMQRVQNWSAARMLYQAEVFNGLGYVGHGVNSAYVWAGTNHEQPGKYVADHVWGGTFDDPQIGVAAVLIRLAQKRPDIAAALTTPTEKPPVSDPATTSTDELAQKIAALLVPALTTAFAAALKGIIPATPPVVEPDKPPVVVPAVVIPPPASTTPVLEKPGVGLGLAGVLLSALLQWKGGIDVTDNGSWGQLLPIISAGVTGLGATGMFGGLGGILSAGLSWLVKQNPQKS